MLFHGSYTDFLLDFTYILPQLYSGDKIKMGCIASKVLSHPHRAAACIVE
ncbi:hypothetical protein CLOSTMETH_02514 [[Clostridium] methylpentosum DSM 5476]|uniref:Uncharacterized protein n=1 Tax=[Clostridium] methylpentosum DSM 5476 TaxID=537013 RepID=C0EF74_9FIRM|nr:hypothetical protein CLOSTMETH_02514 [[Clostridium] methylpentosum DSM 5476]